jgi:uncharacterized lipoprotein YddW (UPF0748 family)
VRAHGIFKDIFLKIFILHFFFSKLWGFLMHLKQILSMKYSYLLVIAALIFLMSCNDKTQSTTGSFSKQFSEPIRGVWLTNIASDALFSKSNIEEAVNFCDSLGFNHIFVVTWNDAMTTYPSNVMESLTGLKIQPELKGRDPLRELIEAAHAKNIKVHAWFEFGFSCSYKKEDGGPIIKVKPHWASLDRNGKLVSKNNFQWMNAFHPEVQSFITSLVLEIVSNYDIDGIQGDDRLPALPSTGGYDTYTVEAYKAENGGNPPPVDEKDYEWVKWRSGKLNAYLKQLVTEARKINPDIIISMAPSIYPWAESEYLQDWPSWVNMGYVDYIMPQVYRYSIDRYEYELDKIVSEQISPQNKSKLYPGILLQVDQYNPSAGMLDSMVKANRKHGINGEVYFFYEGIKKYPEYFRKLYQFKK